jgi:hypothetical protein
MSGSCKKKRTLSKQNILLAIRVNKRTFSLDNNLLVQGQLIMSQLEEMYRANQLAALAIHNDPDP